MTKFLAIVFIGSDLGYISLPSETLDDCFRKLDNFVETSSYWSKKKSSCLNTENGIIISWNTMKTEKKETEK